MDAVINCRRGHAMPGTDISPKKWMFCSEKNLYLSAEL
jgi:hypothetical protein